jgi:hypothetical protein
VGFVIQGFAPKTDWAVGVGLAGGGSAVTGYVCPENSERKSAAASPVVVAPEVVVPEVLEVWLGPELDVDRVGADPVCPGRTGGIIERTT